MKTGCWADTDADSAKARGANGIRYPGSPGLNDEYLVSGVSIAPGAVANVFSIPPGEYARKSETQRN